MKMKFCLILILFQLLSLSAYANQKLRERYQYFEEEIINLVEKFQKECPNLSFYSIVDSSDCIFLIEKIQNRYKESLALKDKLTKSGYSPKNLTFKADFFKLKSHLFNQIKKFNLSSTIKKDKNKDKDKDKDKSKDNAEKLLWDETRYLSVEEFYLNYKNEFKSYGINLKFNNGVMTDDEGKNHELLSWDSDLEKWLSILTGHSSKAKIVADAFYDLIYPYTYKNPDLTNDLAWFLFRYHIYLGAEPKYIKWRLSLYSELSSFKPGGELAENFDQFTRKISENFSKLEKKTNSSTEIKSHKVAIITGSYGGGHISTAVSLKAQLEKDPQTEVKVINECMDLSDPLFVATNGKFRGCQTFNEFTYREGDDRKATLINILNLKLGEYILPTHFEELYNWIKSESPDQIISTIHHVEGVTALAYEFIIPLNIVVTDYEFPAQQWFHLNHVDPELVQYSVPAAHKNFFKRMNEEYSSSNWDTQISGTRTHQIQSRLLAEDSHSDFHDVIDSLKVFRYVPFPIPPQIKPPEDISQIFSDRVELGLSPNRDRKILAVAYGGAANATEINSLIEQIINISPELKHPVQLAVVSAGNQSVINDVTLTLNKRGIPLEDGASQDNSSTKLTAKIFDRLSYPADMAKLYRASDVFISKSGGATTAELINAQGYFMRGFKLWPWEIENTKYLEYLGLALPPDNINTPHSDEEDLSSYAEAVSNDSLLKQLTELLDRPRRLKKQKDAPEISQLAEQMSELNRIFALDPKLAVRQISSLNLATKNAMIVAYLKEFRENLSPMDNHLEFKFNQFLRTVNLMYPDSHIFRYFRNSGMRNIPSVEGLKVLIKHLQKKPKYSSLGDDVSVLLINELSPALVKLYRSGFIGQKSFLIYHIWAHFSAVFVEMKPHSIRAIISDSGTWNEKESWIKDTQVELNKTNLKSIEIFTFRKGRQSDQLSCFAFALRDILENTQKTVFEHLDFLLQEEPKQITKSKSQEGIPDNLSIIHAHPDSFIKTSQSLALVNYHTLNSSERASESMKFVGKNGENLQEFIQKQSEPGLVHGIIKPVNFYTRKKAFKYIEIILKNVLGLEQYSLDN